MQVQITFLEEPTTHDSLTIHKKVATSRLSVYQVYSPSRNSNFALKLYPKDSIGTTRYHKEKLMFHLNHQNVIQNVPIQFHHEQYYGILTEYASHGDLFDLVRNRIINNEVLVRTYFHQLIEGLEYIHSQGVAHLDIKLENLMLGTDFKLKFIDFDQAQPIADNSITSSGTRDYRAPEVRDRTCVNLKAGDIYSAGIVLYCLKANEYMFWESEEYDEKNLKSYGFFNKNNRAFWKARAEIKNNKEFFSKEFIDLVNQMVHKNPNKRPSIKEIKNSKWYKGPVLNNEALKAEMELRFSYSPRKN